MSLYHWRRMVTATVFDDALGSPALYANPFPVFRRLRDAIAALLRRLPGLRLRATDSLVYQPTLGLRALTALPLEFEPERPHERESADHNC
jgi:hypothetical protein